MCASPCTCEYVCVHMCCTCFCVDTASQYRKAMNISSQKSTHVSLTPTYLTLLYTLAALAPGCFASLSLQSDHGQTTLPVPLTREHCSPSPVLNPFFRMAITPPRPQSTTMDTYSLFSVSLNLSCYWQSSTLTQNWLSSTATNGPISN